MGLEQRINQQLNKYPGIKKGIKRVYQRAMYAISPKIKSEGDIERISPDDPKHEYFFGYYDKSPEDATGRYVLCLKAENTWSDVAPASPAQILLIDTSKSETDPTRVKEIAVTHTWNVQQGCMMQWLGPDFDRKIIYNDFRDGRYVSVVLDVFSGAERVLAMPVYSVAADGSFALTLDFSRLHRLRPGYGYSNLPEETRDQKIPDSTAIWKLDIASNSVTPVLSYTAFSTFEPRKEMAGAEHKVNHIMLSPSGKRFMVLHRWFDGQRKYTRLVTAKVDGTEMYNLSDDDMVSHCYWKNDEEIIAFENKKSQGAGYYLMKDKTPEFTRLWPEMTADGHPSYSPDGSLVVTDTYPNRIRNATLRVMRGNRVNDIARVFAPFKYDNDTRCDLHPRWSRNGEYVYFDSVFEGHRGLYRIATGVVSATKADLIRGRENRVKKVCVLLSTYNGEKYLQEQLDSLYAQEGVELIILARDDASSDSTLEILRKNAAEHRNLTWYTGENVKPAKSFMSLIQKSSEIECDYYAFCDQDDRWDKDKLKCAVDMLDLEDNTKPNLYFSNLRIVDQDLNFYRLSHASASARQQRSKYSCLTEDMATGCTIVFNKTASDYVMSHFPEYCSMHDSWVYMICKFFGKVVYDFDAHIDYRQHGDNVVGTYLEKKSFQMGWKRFKRLFNRNLQPRYNNAVSFYECFGDRLEEKDKEKVLEIVHYKDSFGNRMKLFKDKEIYGTSRSRDLRYRGLILLGIV